jgi:hypothetical protein
VHVERDADRQEPGCGTLIRADVDPDLRAALKRVPTFTDDHISTGDTA